MTISCVYIHIYIFTFLHDPGDRTIGFRGVVNWYMIWYIQVFLHPSYFKLLGQRFLLSQTAMSNSFYPWQITSCTTRQDIKHMFTSESFRVVLSFCLPQKRFKLHVRFLQLFGVYGWCNFFKHQQENLKLKTRIPRLAHCVPSLTCYPNIFDTLGNHWEH